MEKFLMDLLDFLLHNWAIIFLLAYPYARDLLKSIKSFVLDIKVLLQGTQELLKGSHELLKVHEERITALEERQKIQSS